MKLIQNSHDLLSVFMVMSITLTVIGLIFLTVIGIAHLTNELLALLIGTLTTTGFVTVIRSQFTKPQHTNAVNNTPPSE